MPDAGVLVTVGVDTHADARVAAALDHLGRELGTRTIPTTTRGFNDLVDWASGFGVIDRIGVEGTGCWGAALARWLRDEGFVVSEVDRPSRRTRRRHGKSDTIDAVAALDASSGKQERHRLNRGGDREANCALHTIAIVRMSHDQRTKKYIARRISQGRTKREAIRCLKRYIARDIDRMLVPIIDPKTGP